MYKSLNFILWINLLLATGLAVFQTSVLAQNAPITTAATEGNAIAGQQVTVPVTVTGFYNIGSISLSLDYDYSKLHFISALKNPALAGSFNVGDNDLGNGMHRLILGWFGSGVSLPDGSTIVDYTFLYQSGTALLQWFDMGPSCEYTDDNAMVLNDIPTATYYINGLVCGALPNPGTISGINALCQGQTSVSYSVPPIINVVGYNWSVPSGAIITTGLNTNSILVDYSAGASSGNVIVCGVSECGNGPVSVLPVTVNPLPFANAGNDTTIGYATSTQLHAALGGSETYNYHWSPEDLLVNPNVQSPQTIQLTSGSVFHLDVTNSATLCQSHDDMTVSVSGGPLGVNPVSVPSSICRGQSAQLFSNVGGGSGSYMYAWTCVPAGTPAWSSNLQNPVVSADTTTQYMLTVNDGFNTSSGTTSLLVKQLPTAIVSGGGEICDDGSLVSVRVDLTGSAPWTIMYFNGLSTTTVSGIMISPYYINTSVEGNYTVSAVLDQNCQGYSSGNAMVIVDPVPVTPVISLIEFTLSSDNLVGNQWYRNDTVIAGANNQLLQVNENGRYADIITLNGCSSDTSNIIEVLMTGSPENCLNSISVFPNPFKKSCFVLIPNGMSTGMVMKVYTDYGKMISSVEVKNSKQQDRLKLDFEGFSPGLYILQIESHNAGRIIKLILQ